MPPRPVQHLNNRGPLDFFWDLPPLTRWLLVLYLATGVGLLFGLVPLAYMYLDWSLVVSKKFQIWRILANFTFLGKPSLKYLFHLVWLYVAALHGWKIQYGAAYERQKFASSTADAVTMLSVVMGTLVALDAAVPMARTGFHGLEVVYALVHLWSREHSEAKVSFFGIISIPGAYLSWAFLVVDLVQGQGFVQPLLGILAGHTYFFLTDVYPTVTGKRLVRTPRWLARLMLRHSVGRVPVAQTEPVHPSSSAFRAFSGKGQKLQ